MFLFLSCHSSGADTKTTQFVSVKHGLAYKQSQKKTTLNVPRSPKNIWFSCNKNSWKCPEVSLKNILEMSAGILVVELDHLHLHLHLLM